MKPIEVGYVAKAHGLSGELGIALHFQGSDALATGRHLALTKGDRRLLAQITGVRGSGKTTLVTLDAIATRASAEAWKGATVFADRGEQELDEGEYYLADLVDAEVWCGAELVGRVERIAMHPSVDTLVIRSPAGQLLEQPLVDEWLQVVDPEAKRVVLASRDGLIEP